MGRRLPDAAAAGTVAGAVSGIPSTVHALLTGAGPLEASLAAGSLLLGDEQRASRLLPAAGLVHAAMSLGWAVVLAATLPARRTALPGGVSGAAIAALDLGLVGRRFPRARRLPLLPQLADHITYGAVVAAVLARAGATPTSSRFAPCRRTRRGSSSSSPTCAHLLPDDDPRELERDGVQQFNQAVEKMIEAVAQARARQP